MASEEDRERHSRRRKRNIVAKLLRDQGDFKGAFSLKVHTSRKQDFKREKLKARDINIEEVDDE